MKKGDRILVEFIIDGEGSGVTLSSEVPASRCDVFVTRRYSHYSVASLPRRPEVPEEEAVSDHRLRDPRWRERHGFDNIMTSAQIADWKRLEILREIDKKTEEQRRRVGGSV